MPRLIGDSNTYVFELRTTGGHSDKYRVELPSVTSVISRTLASPAYAQWAYTRTIDSISGLVSEYAQKPVSVEEILSEISDAERLDKWLSTNRLRPEDIRSERSELGSSYHTVLEELACVHIIRGQAAAMRGAKDLSEKKSTNPSAVSAAIGRWWLKNEPDIVATEQVVFCLEPSGGYAGSLDLVWRDRRGDCILTDLKTRKAGSDAYRSDFLQVGAYVHAWNLQHERETVQKGTVLVAKEDGTFIERTIPAESDTAFLNLLAVDKLTRNNR